MSKVTNIAAALAVVPMLAMSATAFADSPGQLSNGATNYKVRNITTNGTYGQTASAACGDEVKYSVTLANSDYNTVSNLTLKANLASGAINASGTDVTGATTSVSGNAKVSTTGTLTYEAGSTVRVNVNNTTKAETTVPVADGVANGGVNVGDLAGSTYVFVQFKAKVNCAPTPPAQIKVCDLTTKQIVTINENDFNTAKYTKDLTKCTVTTTTTPPTVTPPTELPNTGAGNVVAILVGAVVAGTIASRLYLSRKLARNA